MGNCVKYNNQIKPLIERVKLITGCVQIIERDLSLFKLLYNYKENHIKKLCNFKQALCEKN